MVTRHSFPIPPVPTLLLVVRFSFATEGAVLAPSARFLSFVPLPLLAADLHKVTAQTEIKERGVKVVTNDSYESQKKACVPAVTMHENTGHYRRAVFFYRGTFPRKFRI